MMAEMANIFKYKYNIIITVEILICVLYTISSITQIFPPKVSKIVIFVCFDKMCVVCSKIKFITNITNVIGIHIFYFYNSKHIFITTDIIFTTKHIFYQNQHQSRSMT